MVWEQGVHIIAMLTTFSGQDNEKQLCAEYIPQNLRETRIYGNFRVTLDVQTIYAGFVDSMLTIVHTPSGESRAIHHLMVSLWACYCK
jgi:hypothetical protein